MKINSYLAAALAALSMLFSCSPEEENSSWEDYIKDKQGQQDKKDDEGKQPDDGLVEIEVTAEIDASESYRSMLNPAWKAGDVIAATDGSGAIFKLTAQTDGASAVFKGRINPCATRLGGIYPWRADCKTHQNNSEVIVSTMLPVPQTALDGSELLMCSMFTEKDAQGHFTLKFTPYVPVVKFTVRPEDAGKFRSITVTGRNGEGKLSGDAAVNLSTGNLEPVSTSSSNYVVLEPASGNFAAGTYFFGVYTLSKQTERPFAKGMDFTFTAPSGKMSVASVTQASPAVRGEIVDVGALVPFASDGKYTVSGTVSYSDGTAAAGVSVSDGFTVTVTDANGKYTIDGVTNDCRYIYISLPSDAKVKKNANGSPDFFKTFDPSVQTYDFKLEKQAVENEFCIFALADPQAHNELRGSGGVMQSKVNTDRFLAETVPALNASIKDQNGVPCYGVTLGDIVFSVSNRNSNKSIPVMRSAFSKVNMPVFQTMGNHDFTYSNKNNPLVTDYRSSTVYLKVQRSFEEVFGPIDYSFNRGQAHIVCMRDIQWEDATTDVYHGGFSDAQFEWLKADLANVPKDRKVILCIHIPLISCKDNLNASNVAALIAQYKDATVFSGHTHFKRGYAGVKSTAMYEHVHAAVCGTGWWSSVESDGCPNGYTVYRINGTEIADEYFIGTNAPMNTRSCQMRVYRGNITTGGDYVKFKWPYSSGTILINIFNGDSRWKKVEVRATDPYGRVYTCNEIVENGLEYPSYLY